MNDEEIKLGHAYSARSALRLEMALEAMYLARIHLQLGHLSLEDVRVARRLATTPLNPDLASGLGLIVVDHLNTMLDEIEASMAKKKEQTDVAQ